jgi:hypothetical protein
MLPGLFKKYNCEIDFKTIDCMSIRLICFLLILILAGCRDDIEERTRYFPREVEYVDHLPDKDHFWIFILAGQSNMAGRGLVAPEDTMANRRILVVDQNSKWVYAKEPLHYYEPALTGLDCGLSFANTLLHSIPSDISIGLIPCAVGGSSVEQWLGDSTHREVSLLTNFKNRVDFARQAGVIKGILWHQGENNANPASLPTYRDRLQELFSLFREYIQNDSLPILAGHLGAYAELEERQMHWDAINAILNEIAATDKSISVIDTRDLVHKGDKIHFDSKSQRMLGVRFAGQFLEIK